MDINLAFTRRLLSMAHENIRKAFPDVNLNKSISLVGPHGRNQYFVQIDVPGFPPLDDYYSADNKYEAKYEAWMAFFDKHAPEQVKREIDGERRMSDAILEVTK